MKLETHASWRDTTAVSLALVAAASLVAAGGFDLLDWVRHWLDRFNLVVAISFVLLWLLPSAKHSQAPVQRRVSLALIWGGLALLGLAFFMPYAVLRLLPEEAQPRIREPGFWLVRLFLFCCMLVELLKAGEWVLSQGLRAEILLAGSFVGIIAMGALLLLLPNAMADGRAPLSLIDAIFTSTSATCVTGLGVRDTGADFSTFGHMVLLGLIQVGGLGIITFVALVSSFSNKTLPVSQMVALRQMINAPALGDLRGRIAGIVAITFVVEALGVAALYVFVDAGGSGLQRLEWALFHSVSAFCNAGFAFQPDNLESLAGNMGANYTFIVLIIVGGLGFLVIPELLAVLRSGCRKLLRGRFTARGRLGVERVRFSLQTRLSLITTVALLFFGTGAFWILEGGQVLQGLGVSEAFTVSLFQSVSARTAGFNTVTIGDLQNATLLVIVLLMVIGGCPVSTAGGIKTVTFAILLLGLRALVTGNSRIEAFGRTIPSRVVVSALNVFLLYFSAATAGLILVSWFEPQLAMRDVLFECFSALSTVGLGTGITAQLDTGSKLVLCLLMFVGRIGPIAMVLSVFQTAQAMDYEFPEEDIVVG